ncbi:MAG: IS630 family transposase [Planctomycetaceae bacterium]|nr:IS630 family transposase [Planctomycetaceae bacterium]
MCIGVPPESPLGQDQALRSRSRSLTLHVHDHLPRDELQRLAKTLPGERVGLRSQAILLALQGRSATEVAQALGWSVRAVPTWVARSNQRGPRALAERPNTGRRARRAGPELLRFQERREAGPTPEDGLCTSPGRDLQRILEHEFGVLMSLQAVSDLLHRHGCSRLMPQPQHKDADEELQAIFREVVVDPIQALQEAHPDEEVPVRFEDEARFGPQGTLTRVWARRGSRPRGVRPTQSTSLPVLTAVCASTGAASGLISPALNAAVVNLFLEQFARELPAGVHAVLLWDGAGSQIGEDLRIPKNVSLIQLVPDSPELNPVENLWHDLRSPSWSLRVDRDYEALEGAAMRAWRAVCLQPELVSSIGNAPYVSEYA